MGTIPFLWVPVTALICYLILLVTLLPSSDNQIIKTFCWLLLCFVLWTGSSILMRTLTWPDAMFWYELSLVGLFCTPAMLYEFLHSFFDEKQRIEEWLVWGLTLLTVFPAVLDVYLEKPVPEILPTGWTVFRYHADWRVAIPTTLCLIVLFLAVRFVWQQMCMAEFSLVIIGMVVLAIGNCISILPGNIFPFDTLAGILNAGILFWALYRRKIFKLRIFFSPGTVGLLTCLIISILAVPCAYTLTPFLMVILGTRHIRMITPILWSIAALSAVLLNQLIHWIVQHFFLEREKQQSLILQQFSSMTTRNHDTGTLVLKLLTALEQTFGSRPCCIFLMNEKGDLFIPVYPDGLSSLVKPINKTDPCAVWFSQQNGCIRVKAVEEAGMSVAEDKAAMMQQYNISCIVPFQDKDSLQGILFLGCREGQRDYSNDDLVFLDALSSILSVALKNARLYRQLFHEARTDQLTGLLNRLAFTKALEETLSKKHPFALVMLDLDDFKLYNQLYGPSEGDRALVKIAGLLREQAGSQAVLARYAGKIFMTLLPDADGNEGLSFALHVGESVSALTTERLGGLTFSSGVCSYTGGMENARQLLEYVDMEVFQVKHSGKNSARLYRADKPRSEAATETTNQTEQSSMSTVYAITAAIDAKDHYTFSHSQNVADYARALALAIGMDEFHVHMIYEAGLVHDVGKLSIPEHILSKPGALTPEELGIMKGHVESAVSIIRNLPSLDYVVPAAVTHHECWDGSGYPRGLAGEDIPLGGRCLALADAFDAMTSRRTYKSAYTVEFALQQIRDCAGTQFDPTLCPVFIQLVESGTICPDPS